MDKNLAKYLNQVEETYSNFDSPADNFMYASATPVAPVMASCIQEVQASDPYIFTITNSSSVASAKAVLFGAYSNTNPNVTNYGSDPTITITPSSGSSYFAFLQQMVGNPFMAYTWRLDSNTEGQLNQTLFVNYTNAGNGKSARVPISLVSRRNLFYQNQYGLEFVYPVKVDGNTYFDLTLLKSGVITITIFPKDVADTTQAFGQKTIAKTYEIPTLSALPTVQASNAIAGMVIK